MFTGLIQATGKVLKYDDKKLWLRLPFSRLISGESICVNGACLTVAQKRGRDAAFDVGPETQRLTTLGRLKPGDPVNLERALRIGDRLGGHWVTGHVETTTTIERIESDQGNRWITLKIPSVLARYVIAKGSLAVDGISLTVASVRGSLARIMIVPHTLKHTTLGTAKSGDRVNLEADILAKYVLQ